MTGLDELERRVKRGRGENILSLLGRRRPSERADVKEGQLDTSTNRKERLKQRIMGREEEHTTREKNH